MEDYNKRELTRYDVIALRESLIDFTCLSTDAEGLLWLHIPEGLPQTFWRRWNLYRNLSEAAFCAAKTIL